MTIQGIVTSVNGDKAEVMFMRYSACGKGCESCQGCESRLSAITAVNSKNADVGDTVEVLLPEQSVLPLALTVYLLPLALIFLGGYIFYILLSNLLSAVIGAVLGIIVWLFILQKANFNINRSGKYCGRIINIISQSKTEDDNAETFT